MRILILSKTGDALGIAHRMVMEGNEVKMYIQDRKYARSGVGLVTRVASWRPHVLRSDLVICDMVGFGQYEKSLEKFGKPVLMCNKFADMAELDRGKGLDLFRKHGIEVPETMEFTSPKEALDAIEELWEDPGYVLKPFGNIDTGKTYVVRNLEDAEWALTTYKDEQELLVQKIVEGVEVSTEGWYNGREWIGFNHTFEEKNLFPGGVGRNTGCMGNVVIPASDSSRLVRETVIKLEPWLKKVRYRGPVDVNCIVTPLTAYALEPTLRLGYDAIEALTEGLTEPLGNFLFEVALGIRKEVPLRSGMFMAVRISVPPWPMAEPKEEDAGRPLHGISEEALRHVFLTDIMRDNNGNFVYAAGDGVVFKVTAYGKDVKETKSRVERSLEKTHMHDMQYRTDIGDRVRGDLAQLKEWGWVN